MAAKAPRKGIVNVLPQVGGHKIIPVKRSMRSRQKNHIAVAVLGVVVPTFIARSPFAKQGIALVKK